MRASLWPSGSRKTTRTGNRSGTVSATGSILSASRALPIQIVRPHIVARNAAAATVVVVVDGTVVVAADVVVVTAGRVRVVVV